MPVLLLWAVPAVILLAALVVFLCARCIDSSALQERSGETAGAFALSFGGEFDEGAWVGRYLEPYGLLKSFRLKGRSISDHLSAEAYLSSGGRPSSSLDV
jgi:hypothetical protein